MNFHSDHHTVKVEKTGHYYTIGQLSDTTEYIWLVCHGYGQAADRFIQKFRKLNPNQHYVIAPEGLHRFYWGGVHGQVVASWMTSKDRLDEIREHTNFIHHVLSAHRRPEHKLIFLGFSQGVATVARYIATFQPAFAHLILWAGTFPRDIDPNAIDLAFKGVPIHLFYGDRDQYLTHDIINAELQHYQSRKLKIRGIPYHGEHKIDSDLIVEFAKKFLFDGDS